MENRFVADKVGLRTSRFVLVKVTAALGSQHFIFVGRSSYCCLSWWPLS
jgi:hypothetical protein